MNETLIIVRHGNTFRPGETPTRVGAATDLPLVEEDRARAIGRYLVSRGIRPDKIYASPLARTTRTAELIAEEAGWRLPVIPDPRFTEIDYGPDENKREDEVIWRIGKAIACLAGGPLPSREDTVALGTESIEAWNAHGITPPGWHVDVDEIIRSWKDFANEIPAGATVLLCTSNGMIRFAPHLLPIDYETFCDEHPLKVATGSLSLFRRDATGWRCVAWNVKPYSAAGDPTFPGLPTLDG
jgi:probable phosphoglycerate mutase